MSNLLFDEPPLVVSPTLACAIGLHEAIVLQQIHYWSAHSKHVHQGRKWVYNTYKEWAVQFPFWKPESIRKIVANLRAEYLVDVQMLSPDPANRTNYYAINYGRLREISSSKPVDHAEESTAPPSGKIHRTTRKNPPHGAEESTASLYRTETTTETTAEKNLPEAADASPATAKASPKKKEPAETTPVWEAYADAYTKRYSIPPLRNAKVNANLKSIVSQAGAERAEDLVRHYLTLDGFYEQRSHDIGVLVSDLQKVWNSLHNVAMSTPAFATKSGAFANKKGLDGMDYSKGFFD